MESVDKASEAILLWLDTCGILTNACGLELNLMFVHTLEPSGFLYCQYPSHSESDAK